jgi:predicted dienelactone hydrolase
MLPSAFRLTRSRIAFAILSLATASLVAQQHIVVPREDGQTTPILVYSPAEKPTSCAPLAIISHGAGGGENGLSYLAISMSKLGYTAITMRHQESDLDAVKASIATQGARHPGIRAIVSDPVAERDRLLDVTAALKWADTQCKAPFRVLMGHSMGAETVMLEAGARNMVGISDTIAGRSRFDAYIALSPEGPGVIFPEHAWINIRKPVLVLTGTLDGALNGGAITRQTPWKELPGLSTHCQWLGVIDGATHADMGGNGPGHEHAEPFITSTIASFLKSIHNNACTLPAPVEGFTLQAK